VEGDALILDAQLLRGIALKLLQLLDDGEHPLTQRLECRRDAEADVGESDIAQALLAEGRAGSVPHQLVGQHARAVAQGEGVVGVLEHAAVSAAQDVGEVFALVGPDPRDVGVQARLPAAVAGPPGELDQHLAGVRLLALLGPHCQPRFAANVSQVGREPFEVERGARDQEYRGSGLVHRADDARARLGRCQRLARSLPRRRRGRVPPSYKLTDAMVSASDQLEDPEAREAAWDLSPLLDGDGPDGVEQRLQEALGKAQSFAHKHAGKLQELDGAGLVDAMRELAAMHDLVGRAGAYAALRFSTDTAEPANGALLQRVQERETEIETTLLFFELEWAALDDEVAERLLATDGLDFCAHHLRRVRRYREHLLSEPEERILAEKSVTGASAWGRLFEELTSAIEVQLPRGGGQPSKSVALDVALSRLASPDREVRRTSAEAVSAALEPGLRTRAFLFNTLLADKATDDRLRRYPSWLAARNLANEVDDDSVAALLAAVHGRYELARRWYRLKAGLLGLDRLADYDRMAAVTEDEASFGYGQAREIVLDCYSSFSPKLGELVSGFFDGRWIDAPVRPAKRGGAFCAAAVPSVHPYVLLNYTSRRRDVLTLAHELGHGVHFALAAVQGPFHQHTPLTVAETASVFGETLVFGRLLERDTSPDSRLALLAENIEGAIATVFRQVAMSHFEDLVHTERRERGEISVQRFGELWAQSQEEMLGDSVEVSDGYRSWWSYIPHFIGTPGYVYAYAYGQLLALSVYNRYEQQGEAFVPRYLELLEAGGSRSPEELGGIVGVDLADPGFWDAGLDLLERRLVEAEEAARASGRV
jgi:oligoendopeptidase F